MKERPSNSNLQEGELKLTRKPRACVVVEAASTGEDDERQIGIAEDGELPGLLHQPAAALGEGHLSVCRVVDPLDCDLSSPHPLLLILRSLNIDRSLNPSAGQPDREDV